MSAFENLKKHLKQLPGLGYRSSERIALHLLVEKPAKLPELVRALEEAAKSARRCERCGNLAEAVAGSPFDQAQGPERESRGASDPVLCTICADERRDPAVVCVVEHVPDLGAVERSGAFRGTYHVLHGKLSPINGVEPGDLNLKSLFDRSASGTVRELILAVSNDVEGEATCHYITKHLPADRAIKVTRIGFGLPSGAGVLYADSITLKSALSGRRDYQ